MFRIVSESREVDRLEIGDLSDRFNPYLRYFMREAMRTGGEVTVSGEAESVDGVFLCNPAERVGSIFTRSREVAQVFYGLRSGISVYSEVDLGPREEVYRIYEVEFVRWREDHPFGHPIRAAGERDVPGIRALLLAVYGAADERWFATMASGTERWFLSEIDGQLAGAGCASLVGRHGRLHSLSVAPAWRRLGVGADLVFARLLWLRAAGAERALSEISERNVPSRSLAERAGMRDVGPLFRYDRPMLPVEPGGSGPPP